MLQSCGNPGPGTPRRGPPDAAATIDRALANSFYIDDKQLQTVKPLVGPDSPLIGRPLSFVRGELQLCILSHRRFNKGAVLFPPEETIVEENDKITILAQGFVIGQIHELNRDQAALGVDRWGGGPASRASS